MSSEKKINVRAERRARRVREKMRSDRPRVSIFRSARHIYAQIIDDKESRTLLGFSSAQLKKAAGDKKQVARAVGKELAKQAAAQGITTISFDRGPFLYHGRVKELAEGLREGGLVF